MIDKFKNVRLVFIDEISFAGGDDISNMYLKTIQLMQKGLQTMGDSSTLYLQEIFLNSNRWEEGNNLSKRNIVQNSMVC